MPPRTGPARKRRVKQSAPRHFAVIGSDENTTIVVANRIELADGSLVFRDGNDAISHILADGEWRDVHPASMGELTVLDDPPPDDREQASLVNENDPVFQPTRKEEQDSRFVPSSAEEAQRILLELERRLRSPTEVTRGEDSPDAPPPTPRKD